MTSAAPVTQPRAPLTRQRIVEAALRYVDEHGLAALSMHKLGAELGVKGMSLYNHVDGKDDVLDALVEAVWTEAEGAAPARPDDWRAGFRALAHGIRAAIYRHPNAAPLLTGRSLMPEASLRAVRAHIAAAVAAGVPEERAYALLRTLTSYALGSGLAEVSWGLADPGCTGCRPVAELLRPGTPADLAAVAEVFCGQSDPNAQFELGLDLMLRGVDCTPANQGAPAEGHGVSRGG